METIGSRLIHLLPVVVVKFTGCCFDSLVVSVSVEDFEHLVERGRSRPEKSRSASARYDDQNFRM